MNPEISQFLKREQKKWKNKFLESVFDKYSAGDVNECIESAFDRLLNKVN